MKFTLYVTTETKDEKIKERCLDVLADLLKRYGYFSVEINKREIDISKIGKA